MKLQYSASTNTNDNKSVIIASRHNFLFYQKIHAELEKCKCMLVTDMMNDDEQ